MPERAKQGLTGHSEHSPFVVLCGLLLFILAGSSFPASRLSAAPGVGNTVRGGGRLSHQTASSRSDEANRWNSANGPSTPQGAAVFAIGPSMSASWFNPAEGGHGIMIHLLNSEQAWMCWFAFDLDGNRAWICALGTINGDTLEFPNAFTVEGGNFPPLFNPAQIEEVPWGSITVTFTGCDTGMMEWSTDAPGFQSGSMPLARLTSLWGSECVPPPPTGSFAYVGLNASKRLAVVETAGFTVVKTIALCGNPWGMAISPDGAWAFAGLSPACPGIAVIDTATGLVDSQVDTGVGTLIRNLKFTPDGAHLYAVEYFSSALIVIDATSLSIEATIADAGNEDVAFSPDGAFAYVVGQAAPGLRVIDTASRSVVHSTDVGVTEGIAMTPDGKFAYLAQPGNVGVFDTSTRTVVANIATVFEDVPSRSVYGQADIVVTADGAFAYRSVTCCAKVAVIDTATNTLVDAIDVPAHPSGLALAPDGTAVYVASPGTGDFTVIDQATNTVVATTTLGTITEPINVAITPN